VIDEHFVARVDHNPVPGNGPSLPIESDFVTQTTQPAGIGCRLFRFCGMCLSEKCLHAYSCRLRCARPERARAGSNRTDSGVDTAAREQTILPALDGEPEPVLVDTAKCRGVCP
jgi:hypothetical protein